MKKIIYILITISLLSVSCTKDNYIDTGVSNGRFDGNALEYMETSSYNWDSTRILIAHAGEDMVRIFKGEDPAHKEITFLGITNHSIRRYLLHQGYKRVTDLDKEWCRKILLRHLIDGKIRRKDIPVGKQSEFGTIGTGGKIVKTLDGRDLWLYVELQDLGMGNLDFLPKHVNVNFMSTKNYAIASADIEPDNAIIHALDYNFTIGDSEANDSSSEEPYPDEEEWW